jgi:hypothetical protein
MKVVGSEVSMQASHRASTLYARSEQIRFWVGNERPDFEARNQRVDRPGDTVRVSEEARRRAAEALQPEPAGRCCCACSCSCNERQAVTMEDLEAALIARLFESITGHTIKVVSQSEITGNAERARQSAGEEAEALRPERPEPEGEPERAGWGLEVDVHERREERERTCFEAEATVKTSCGEEIQVKVSLSMSRELIEESRRSIREGDAKKIDPLVINFDGTAAELTKTRFSFDLDSDGTAEAVPFVTAGSGFLALDRDGDGIVTDGSELFGPKTGDGFAELARYDEDGNRWIDEGDSVWSRLRIWSRDPAGADSLDSLDDRGVGAIYLGKIETPFTVKDGRETLGQIASTGIYLQQEGGAGTVQQVDLAVA